MNCPIILPGPIKLPSHVVFPKLQDNHLVMTYAKMLTYPTDLQGLDCSNSFHTKLLCGVASFHQNAKEVLYKEKDASQFAP